MSATSTARWVGIGLLGLPLYGALTFWSSMNPQPDPNTRFEAWSRYVTTDHYVWSHVLGSTLGLILAIFGTFALGAYLANGPAGRLGLVAMVITVFGMALFLPAMGVSYLLRTPRRAGAPGRDRGVRQAALHLRGYRVHGNRPAGHRAPVRGQLLLA